MDTPILCQKCELPMYLDNINGEFLWCCDNCEIHFDDPWLNEMEEL
jgi:Zn-finger protein